VPLVVIGLPVILKMLGTVAATLVTVPVAVPDGVLQTPSPRQKVVALADVPLLRFVTGKLPVTFDAKLTNVVDVVPVPPFAIGNVPVTLVAKLTNVVDVVPVPPLAIANVPATVTAPDVAVAGVKPVEPKSIVVTPSAVLEATLTKSLPFHAQIALSPVTIVTPEVGPVTPTSLTDCAVALITTYTLLVLGALIVNRLAGVPVQLMTMY
jgi:hypothetical protein